MIETSTVNGVTFFEKPYLTNCIEFLFNHLDCNFIAKKIEHDTDKVYVIAFAENKSHNDEIDKVFHSKGYDKDCIIVQGMDSQEVNSID